ncbi:helix-turn-helix domain-containing protein [Leptobacterium flavescens]|uniref:Helix-turn-helix domain-containing protein n=1 Tax=Leptobacterium flavescens TaxID=472055 RepID=A0A6P0UFU5_9FLAO|nr:helix-turn-helix domain-containing protein [Leptobacterium flavescens]
MTFYETEINRIKKICFSNDKQLETVISLRNFIDNNFEKEINLKFLSHTLLTSKYHLLRLFKRYYGITPKQYLTIRRLEKSKEYLKKGMSVSEVCYNVGFNTHSSFSTLFKNKIGLTPTEFQKKQLSQNHSR